MLAQHTAVTVRSVLQKQVSDMTIISGTVCLQMRAYAPPVHLPARRRCRFHRYGRDAESHHGTNTGVGDAFNFAARCFSGMRITPGMASTAL